MELWGIATVAGNSVHSGRVLSEYKTGTSMPLDPYVRMFISNFCILNYYVHIKSHNLMPVPVHFQLMLKTKSDHIIRECVNSPPPNHFVGTAGRL